MQKLIFLSAFFLVFYFGSVANSYSAEAALSLQVPSNQIPFKQVQSNTVAANEPLPQPASAADIAHELKIPTIEKVQKPPNSGIEESKDAIYEGAVDFAKWVDKFFGERQELEDAGYDYLRLINRVILLEGESIKYRPRIKAKVHLPQFNKKTSLLFSNNRAGSGDESELEEDQVNQLNDDEGLSAAINYETDIYAKSKFDFRLGIGSGLDTFAFIKQTMPLHQSDDLEIRNFNYLFWEEDQGFGVRVELELNRVLDENNLFRWKYSTLRAEKSDGTEWYNRFSLVNRLGHEKSIAYELGINGDTEQSYAVENYRFSLRFRNKTSIDWLYFEIEPEVRFIRTPESIDRELVTGVTFRLEVQFEKNN